MTVIGHRMRVAPIGVTPVIASNLSMACFVESMSRLVVSPIIPMANNTLVKVYMIVPPCFTHGCHGGMPREQPETTVDDCSKNRKTTKNNTKSFPVLCKPICNRRRKSCGCKVDLVDCLHLDVSIMNTRSYHGC
jgi:hypothetical protein